MDEVRRLDKDYASELNPSPQTKCQREAWPASLSAVSFRALEKGSGRLVCKGPGEEEKDQGKRRRNARAWLRRSFFLLYGSGDYAPGTKIKNTNRCTKQASRGRQCINSEYNTYKIATHLFVCLKWITLLTHI